MENSNCEFCSTAEFRYTCPRCNVRYCSVACYKSEKHLQCSEEFYKSCIQEELAGSGQRSNEDVRKMYEILQRMRETDAGVEGINFADPLDSDDEPDPDGNVDLDEEAEEGEEEEQEELANRLQGVDLNDAEDVWQHLSETERLEFQTMIESGDIVKLIPDFKPWWIPKKESKIVVLDSKQRDEKKQMPVLAKNIPNFSDICKKEPSPCVHYNLWNLLSAYACVVRFFKGEHLCCADEAAAHLVNLSAALKYGTNFEDTEDAILSVESEALTTGNGAAAVRSLYVESREQLKEDARQLMSTSNSKLLALSDILNIFQLAKSRTRDSKKEQNEFQKLFAICNASVELNLSKMKQIIKKIEFLLAFVNRSCGYI